MNKFWVYIIQNKINHKRYIGSTENLARRLEQHNLGSTPSTKYGKGTWSMVYTELFATREEALNREKVIKSYKGGEGLKKLLSKRD